MDRETRIKFDNTIDASIAAMTREARQLINLSLCKPLNIDQQGGLRWLQTILSEQVEKVTSEKDAA